MDLEFLRKVSLFSKLSTDELNLVAPCLHTCRFKEGEKIISDREESDKLFILHLGKVVVSKKMTMVDQEEELDKTLTVLSAENFMFFGEIGLLGFRKRTANVVAKTDCELYSLNQKDFMTLSEKYPGIGFKILLEISRQLSRILEKTNEDVLKLTTALIYALK
ncbi:MAG: cyclic nucleotide-binding domain-containing protein [Candidatus Cloacimonetes bacterium]|nr:cyclic nucleotide-binding domain-containing protein [Candidatus Cloacimonadota bacterium]